MPETNQKSSERAGDDIEGFEVQFRPLRNSRKHANRGIGVLAKIMGNWHIAKMDQGYYPILPAVLKSS